MIKNKKKIIFLSIIVVLCTGLFTLYKYGEEYKNDSTKETIIEKNSVEKNAINSVKNQDNIDDIRKERTNQASINNISREEAKQVSAAIPIKEKESYVEYVVKPGDTISKIYSEHIVSYTFSKAESLILKENKLGSLGILTVGKKIRIPSLVDKGYIKHKVAKGESISVIAKKYMGKKSLDDEIRLIRTLNGKENTEIIEVGQVLLIQKNN